VKAPHQRARTTTLARLLGRKLAPGTRVTVRAGTQARTITIPRGR
jgi:hypothetical protein